MKRVYLALPVADDVTMAIRGRLARKKSAKHVELVDDLEAAQVVVTSSRDIDSLPESLPASVELLQLTDCGGGQRYQDVPNLRTSNASTLYETEVVMFALVVVREMSNLRQALEPESLQLGLVGLGNLGFALLDLLAQHIAMHSDDQSDPMNFHVGRVVVNDVRTPQQGVMDALQQQFGESGIAVRRVTLDQLLSTSDVVVVAVHHGPTADPLLDRREARLLDPRAWIVDVSEQGVVDPSAFLSLEEYRIRLMGDDDAVDAAESDVANQLRAGPVYVRVSDVVRDRMAAIGVDVQRDPENIAKFVGRNLRRFDRGKSIAEVEHVDFPSAGDPAFWSSRMSPRQD